MKNRPGGALRGGCAPQARWRRSVRGQGGRLVWRHGLAGGPDRATQTHHLSPPSVYAPFMDAGNTINDSPAEMFSILAFGDACGRQSPLQLAALPGDLSIEALRLRLRCSACGSRETSIRIVSTGAGSFRYCAATSAD